MVYPSPLQGYENAPPLPTEVNADGKSLVNLPNDKLDPAYEVFPDPIDSSNNGFDFHIYYFQNNPKQLKYAHELHERIRRTFPELRIYKCFDKPVGPHVVAMFEVNVFTPLQLGTLTAWMVVNRGPLSVLIHPNTGDDVYDHSELATWMGPKIELDIDLLKEFAVRRKVAVTASSA